MKLSINRIILLIFSSFCLIFSSYAEDSYEDLSWQFGPKNQQVLGVASFFLPDNYSALNIAETDKYLELSENFATGADSFFGPIDSSWDGYFRFDKVGYIKDDNDINADDLLQTMRDGQKISNKHRKENGWPTFTILGWEYPPFYDDKVKRLEWAFLMMNNENNSKFINYETRILGRNGVMEVVLVSSPEDLNYAVKDLKETLSTFSFNPGEKYSEYQKGDRVAEFGLAALIAGGAAAVASKKGLWALIAGFLVAAKKFAFAIVIALFAGIASIFRRKK